ncbi:DUF47 domain-containing protein [Thalassotalea aquiviva]|uniref:DUF47 domain-containing protein n=1 Tax=Thalassotalea aquiviva TaxID=3242415 RepID=UPI00352AC7CD
MFNFKKTFSLLSNSRKTDDKIHHYLDRVTKSQLIFNSLWDNFFQTGPRSKQSITTLYELTRNESEADYLRREIETLLFEKTLIPDARADVMELLELLDEIVNLHEAIGIHIKIEKPVFGDDTQEAMQELLKQVTNSVDNMVLCTRSFFSDLERVREYTKKTQYFESEADKACTALKMKIFDSDLSLEQKIQTRYFIDRIDDIANLAEDTVDKIFIYTLKRSI